MMQRPIAAVVLGLLLVGTPAAGQQFALKGGASFSRFEIEGDTPFTDQTLSTVFGGHYRMKLGPIWVQPEALMTVKGAAIPERNGVKERIRLEYLEIPLLVAVPFTVSAFHPYVFAGPVLALETRCRWIIEENGLKTNLGCDPPTDDLFYRNAVDLAATAGGGIGYRLGGGLLMVEARYTSGLRNIVDNDTGNEVRNRTIAVLIGYTIAVDNNDR